MRKPALTVVVFSCVTVLIGIVLFQNVLIKTFRYSTPEESFNKGKPGSAELVKIFQDDDVAFIISKNDQAYTEYLIKKDQKGWSPLSLRLKSTKHLITDQGFIDVVNVNDKYVVYLTISKVKGSSDPSISDSLGSQFTVEQFQSYVGNICYAYSILETELEKGYSINIDGFEFDLF